MAESGYSFTPGAGSRLQRGYNQGYSPQQSQALKVLSLRLPQSLSGRPISPDDLLRPGLGSGAPTGAVGSTLARLSGAPGGPSAGSLEPPSVPSLGASPAEAPLAVSSFGGAPSPFGGARSDISSLADLVSAAMEGGGRPLIGFEGPPRVGEPPKGPIGPPTGPTPVGPADNSDLLAWFASMARGSGPAPPDRSRLI